MEFCRDYVRILFSGILAKYRDSLQMNFFIWTEFRFLVNSVAQNSVFRGILYHRIPWKRIPQNGIPRERNSAEQNSADWNSVVMEFRRTEFHGTGIPGQIATEFRGKIQKEFREIPLDTLISQN